MRVIEHGPGNWYLYAEGQALFLEVHCKRRNFAHSVLLRLDADETRGYGIEGRGFLDALANAVQVADADEASPYRKRDAAGLYSDKIAGAMEEWIAQRTLDNPGKPST
jgi:3-methyladenine DNA glycosylase Mpg